MEPQPFKTSQAVKIIKEVCRWVFNGALLVSLVGLLYGSYQYGHQEGMQDSETEAMRLLIDRCFVHQPPANCQILMDAYSAEMNWYQNESLNQTSP